MTDRYILSIDPGEEWRRLPQDTHGPYEVSNTGKVRNLAGKVLSPEVAKSGHLRVHLYRPGMKPKHFQVHRLVALAFIGASNLDVLHWDDNPQNNNLSNLRYGTDRDNWYDSARNGRRRVSGYCLRGHRYTETNETPPRRRCLTCELKVDRANHFKKIERGIGKDDERHGQYAGYRAGCRCPDCLEANKVYKREWARNDRKRKVSSQH